jgi:hypothetical protein
MYKSISIRNKNVSVRFHERRIGIISDEQLLSVVTEMPEAATDELVSAIKKEFHAQFNKDFDVSDASMAVEIWGHVFTEKFADAVKEMAPLKLVNSLAEKISSHCDVINIGKKDHDRQPFYMGFACCLLTGIAAMLLRAMMN